MGESLEVHCDSIPVMSSVDCVYLCFYRLFAAPLYINDYTLLVRDLMHQPLLFSCPLGSSTLHAPMINIPFYHCSFFAHKSDMPWNLMACTTNSAFTTKISHTLLIVPMQLLTLPPTSLLSKDLTGAS